MMMTRYFAVLAAVFCLAGPASAQTAALVTPPKAAAQPAADPAQIKQLADTLNDPTARAKLIAQLNLLAAAQAKAKPAESQPFGTRAIDFLSAQLGEATEEFSALGHAVVGVPAAERWLETQLSDPVKLSRWEQLAGALAVVFAAGAAAFVLGWFALRKIRHAIEINSGKGSLHRLWAGISRFLLDLVPVIFFGVSTYLVLPALDLPSSVRIAALTMINATLLVMGVIALSRLVFAPRFSRLRLFPIGDAPAAFFHRWICWVGGVIAIGWFGIATARVFGMPRIASNAALKLIGLVVTVMLIVLILRQRQVIAKWIRGEDRGDNKVTERKASAFWSTRRRLAATWHLLASVYLIVVFAIWALNFNGGFDFVLRATVITIAVICAARVVVMVIDRLAEHSLDISRAAKDRFPHLQDTADRYVPLLRGIVIAVIWLVTVLGLIDIWGIDSFDWFATPEGRSVLAKIVSIAFVLVSSVIAWELVSAITERHLVGSMQDGTPIERSQRVRTLLPLLRNAFLIFLIVIVTLIVLSEIGLNIAPLLAGAGVIGLAIGFGAQTLVKDVITGIFILFENTIAVGDVVDVGGGHSGLVESISIRAIKMRDGAGAIHSVPFSNVTSVINRTKDFAYAVFNIKVDYAQDIDYVSGVVKALGVEMQSDPAFTDQILTPFEVIGIDSFADDAVVLQAQFKTKARMQWGVAREFRLRLKKRFDELKIPMSFPSSMVLSADGLAVQVKGDKPEPAPVAT